MKNQAHRLAVAPMMDWTDRHCRAFHRTLSRRAQLWTEMVTAPAVIHGDRDRLLGYEAAEHPVVLQLGGSDPAQLAQAAAVGADYGYDEINLNCGCPSDRVQSGCFGAVLMERPALVAECVAAMIAAQPRPVTVKCRIGVDDQVPEAVLPAFLETVSAAGVTHFVVHARKAWLQGLSPKENREIPPLNHPLVVQMKRDFPHLEICLNGGLTGLAQVPGLLDQGLDGAMFGRAAYHDPAAVLLGADSLLWGAPDPVATAEDAALAMRPYIARHLERGGRLHQITRHMLGLFTGRPGARSWRRLLSEAGGRPGSGLADYDAALAAVTARAA
nr:tRNA dihydrouridine(20/20a) synthase DusA [Gemmobacter sp.]